MRAQRGMFQVPVAGVTLISVLLMVSVMGLMMGRAAATWRSQVMRELEEELIFRGEQYRWAIEQFYQVNRRPPTKLEELCPEESGNRRYIRRCWDDPITREPFRLISAGQVAQRRQQNEAKRAQEEAEEGPTLGGFRARGDRDRAESRRDGGPRRSQFDYVLPGQESRQQLSGERPFIGVASDSDEEGFKVYLESNVYSEWEFVANIAELAHRGGAPSNGATGAGGSQGRVGGDGGGSRNGGNRSRQPNPGASGNGTTTGLPANGSRSGLPGAGQGQGAGQSRR